MEIKLSEAQVERLIEATKQAVKEHMSEIKIEVTIKENGMDIDMIMDTLEGKLKEVAESLS